MLSQHLWILGALAPMWLDKSAGCIIFSFSTRYKAYLVWVDLPLNARVKTIGQDQVVKMDESLHIGSDYYLS